MEDVGMTEKFCIQDAEYDFPYHYLPWFNNKRVFRSHKHLAWGLEYMAYMSFVEQRILDNKPDTLLDIGCGDGRLVQMVKGIVPRISGVDLSKRAIAFARAFNPEVTFRCEDIASIQETYDWLTLSQILEHIQDEEMSRFLSQVARLVRDNGRVLVTVPTVNYPSHRKHYRHYDLDSLRNTVRPYFEIENHWWLYRLGWLVHCLRFMMVNNFWVLNFSPLLSLLWWIHKRQTYFAGPSTGKHLVCLLKPITS